MKKVIITIILCIALSLSACNMRRSYPFRQPVETITNIYITEISVSEQHEILEKDLVEIEDIGTFLSEFSALPCYQRWSDPQGIFGGCIVIKIVYESGEYDLNYIVGQARFVPGVGLCNNTGTFCFDKERYIELIQKYLPIDSDQWSSTHLY